MGDLLNDLNLSDIIPSFAPTRSDSPAPNSGSSSSPPPQTNSQPTSPPPPPPSPSSSGAADDAGSAADASSGSAQSPTSRPSGGGGTTPPTTNTNRDSSNGSLSGSSTDTAQSSPPANTPRTIRNGTLSVQPKPAALVGTTGNTSTAPKASNTNNGSVDGTESASAASGGVPIGAILGSVLAGVIMVTLAVTLLVAMRRKNRARRLARIQPIARNRSNQGRAGLMELGAKEEPTAWKAREAPQLPPLQLSHDTSPTLNMTFTSPVQPSPVHDSLSPSHGFLGSISQQRPDSVGSIQDAPMNYFVALEERVPRAGLRVMNRASNASVADE